MIVTAELQHKTQLRLAKHYIDKLRALNEAYRQGYDNITYGLRTFDVERPQIERWQSWLAATAEYDDLACELCSELPRAGRQILPLRLSLQEYKAWNEVGLAAARRQNDQNAEVIHLLDLGFVIFSLGEYEQALTVVQQGYELASMLGNLAQVALALRHLAEINIEASSLELAAQQLERSVALFRRVGDDEELATSLSTRGFMATYDGNWQAGEAALHEAIKLYTAMGDRGGVARSLTRVSTIEQKQGHLDEAFRHAEQALTILETLGAGRGIVVTLSELATTADTQNNFELAAAYYKRAIANAERYGFQKFASMLQLNLGYSFYLQSNYEEARHFLVKALSEARALGQTIGTAFALVNLVPVYLHFDQALEATNALREAAALSRQAESPIAKMAVVVAAVQIWAKTAKFREAALWAGLVLTHPQAEHENRVEIDKLRPQLEAALGSEAFVALLEQGSHLDLEACMAEISKR